MGKLQAELVMGRQLTYSTNQLAALGGTRSLVHMQSLVPHQEELFSNVYLT